MASLLDLAQARLGGLLAPPQRPSMVGLLGGQRPQGTLASTIAGYTPPQMQAMSNQQVMDYARTVAQTAQQNLQNQMSDLDKALVMGQGGIQVGDREALARLMEQVPGLMGATAYHGTPHTIRGKFDISKVGTGEGAQAYGHGMYFAENPAVAQAYKTAGETIKYTPTLQKFTSGANYYIDDAGNYMKVRDWVKNDKPTPVSKEEYLQKFNEIKKMYELQPQGNLYKVDIPDEYIPNMLDWDKPLSKMTKKEAEIIEPLKEKLISQKNPYHPDSFETIGQVIQFSRGSNPNLEKQLLEAGIPGIKYLDEGSRAKGKGTYNFVVFDPTDVKILEKNSQKVEGLLD